MKNEILILQTGGTIAGLIPEYKEVQKINEIYPQISQIDLYVSKILKYSENIIVDKVCYKDSREVSDSDRNNILKKIRSSKVTKVIITHGTYTMDVTGKFLLENLTKEELETKNIIITGAMYPWSFMQSDAPANIGASLAFLSLDSIKGVHICMHQRLFDPRKLKKDAENLIFLETE